MPIHQQLDVRFRFALLFSIGLVSLVGVSVKSQVRFDDCQPVSGGGVTCNTVPYGNTRTQMIDGEYGLMDQASPGWAEYDPYEGYDDMFGGNQT
jgi:hypothetical protein